MDRRSFLVSVGSVTVGLVSLSGCLADDSAGGTDTGRPEATTTPTGTPSPTETPPGTAPSTGTPPDSGTADPHGDGTATPAPTVDP